MLRYPFQQWGQLAPAPPAGRPDWILEHPGPVAQFLHSEKKNDKQSICQCFTCVQILLQLVRLMTYVCDSDVCNNHTAAISHLAGTFLGGSGGGVMEDTVGPSEGVSSSLITALPAPSRGLAESQPQPPPTDGKGCGGFSSLGPSLPPKPQSSTQLQQHDKLVSGGTTHYFSH